MRRRRWRAPRLTVVDRWKGRLRERIPPEAYDEDLQTALESYIAWPSSASAFWLGVLVQHVSSTVEAFGGGAWSPQNVLEMAVDARQPLLDHDEQLTAFALVADVLHPSLPEDPEGDGDLVTA